MRRALALLLLLALPAGAAQVALPVNLGAPGLDLEIRIWLVEGGEVTAEAWPIDDVVVTDLGDGDYLFSGLPDAGGTDRYALLVATTEEPERALVRYEWGAEAGTSVVFRNEVSAVSGTTLVEDDTFGTISVVVRSGLPSNIGSGTATFYARNADTDAVVVSARPATISNVVQDVATGSYGATFTYQREAALGADPGTLNAEFRITVPGGASLTVPQPQPLRILVRKKL